MSQDSRELSFVADEKIADDITAAQNRAILWQPRFMTEGANLCLTPAIFWLVSVVRPNKAVVLGLGEGQAFAAVAQAMNKLDSDGEAIGVAGESDGPKSVLVLKVHLDQLYRDTTTILPYSDEGFFRNRLEPGCVDLLVIDAVKAAVLSELDLTAWMTSVADDGVLAVIRSDDDQNKGGALHRALRSWQTTYIDVGSGIDLFQRNRSVLDAPMLSRPGQTLLRRLGHGIEAIASRDASIKLLAKNKTLLSDTDTARQDAEKRLSELEKAYASQSRRCAQLGSELHDRRSQTNDLLAHVATLTEEASSKAQEHADARRRLLDQAAQARKLDDGREAELLRLRKIIAEARAHIETQEVELSNIRIATEQSKAIYDQRIGSLQREIEDARAEIGRKSAQCLIVTQIAEEARCEAVEQAAARIALADQAAEVQKAADECQSKRQLLQNEVDIANAQIEDYAAKNANLEGATEDLRVKTRKQEAEIAVLSEQIVRAAEAVNGRAVFLRKLQTQLEDARAEITLNSIQRIRLTEIAEEARLEADTCAAASLRMKTQIDVDREEIVSLGAEVDTLKLVVKRHVEKASILNAKLDQVKKKLRTENTRRIALQSSLSWRLTAPLRSVNSWLKWR
ncbi:hypothetical protein MLD63_06910 [Paracoccus sp. TK19116]|uniref:Chromosome partition protein Smc n=1 Tax=Paracoccus albicereus TaxID=2922394 RepID=A0ABT1MPD0_9RHOB|nr:hypothetical protein [Paracoccus albicereus]MCQ0970148.1 hypothetical protein [Paracoccus albicereus]